MAGLPELRQDNFWSGIGNDIRSRLASGFWYSENMDIKGKSLKQIVNNQAENACSYNVNNYITKLLQSGTDVYGLGQDGNANNDTTIWKKTNALNGAWGIPTNGTVAGSTFAGGDALFAILNGIIYFDAGNGSVGKYTIATNTMNATWKTLAGAKGGTIWQGKIWCWSGQDIYVIDPVADTLTNMKTVNTEQTIVDLVPYGNLLMVVCTSIVTISRAYLWDGVSTTTWTEILEIGYGTVAGAANLKGTIVVVIGLPNKRAINIQTYNGGSFQDLMTYTGRLNRAATFNYVVPASKVKVFNNYIYFLVTGTKPDGTYAGLYEYAVARIGRDEPLNPLAFSIYKTLDFSVYGLNVGQTVNNDFTIIENVVAGADTADRIVAAMINSDTSKTTFFLSSTNTYTGEAGVLETFKRDGSENGHDASIEKQLRAVSVQYEPLPAGGSVTVKYRKDNELTWTTIYIDDADNSISHEAVTIEATDSNLPTFKEIQFRVEVVGNVTLIGWKAAYEPLAQNF